MSDDIFNDDNKPKSNWFKMEKVGDKVAGTILDIFEKEGDGDFPAQRVFEIEQEDGEAVFYGISLENKYLAPRTKRLRVGDEVGFRFEKEIPAKKKGYSPAKSIEVFVKYTEEGNKQRDGEELMK